MSSANTGTCADVIRVLCALEKSLTGVVTRLDELAERMDYLESRLDDLDGQVHFMERTWEDVDHRVTTLSEDVNWLQLDGGG
jgi:uncharacterized protein YoxC